MAFLTLVLPVNHVDELYSLAGRNQGRDGEASADRRYTDRGSSNFAAKPGPRGGDSLGRWPANVVLDEEAARLLDEQTGELKGGVAVNRNREPGTMTSWYGKRASQTGEDVGYGDTGGASRFYYCPKASKADRGDGNTHPTVKNTDLMRWLIRLITPPGGAVLDPFAGSGSTGKAAVLEGMSFVGIEQSPEYHAIASGRIAAARAALLPLAEAV